MDMDVEAMLEAPYQEKPHVEESTSQRSNGPRLDIQRPPDMIVHDLVLIVTIIDPVAVPDIVAADIEVAQETTDVRDPVREITIIPVGDPTLVVDEEEVEAHVDKAEAAGHTSNRRRRNRSASPPIPEEERDKRTVFVTQLSVRLESRELEEFFSQAGKVRDAKIIMDRNSRRSKGVGYVEFYEEASVQNALAMSGQKLLGLPVMVQLTEAEKNRLALQAQNAAFGQNDISYHRLYVGSIHFKLTEDDLRQIFEPFGPIDSINLHMDDTGRSRGFAFVQFRNGVDAKQALDKMNGYELAGRNLRVGLVNERNSSGGNYTLDEEETSGISLNSTSRAELMQKLAARQSDTSTQGPVYKPAPAPPKVNVPVAAATRTIMLNNMFNPAEETEPNWVQELEADIKDECNQYGQILHVNVNDDSLGEVFLKFDRVSAGERALKSLNGRWFGGKQASI
ncbi:Phosphatidylinositol-3-phosphatase SAC1 [Umbelopsis nana]